MAISVLVYIEAWSLKACNIVPTEELTAEL